MKADVAMQRIGWEVEPCESATARVHRLYPCVVYDILVSHHDRSGGSESAV